MSEKIVKTEAQWKEQLTAEQFDVTRKKGTERAFTGEYWDTKTPGTYRCRCCGTPLTDAWARCAAPNASPTNTSPFFASSLANSASPSVSAL